MEIMGPRGRILPASGGFSLCRQSFSQLQTTAEQCDHFYNGGRQFDRAAMPTTQRNRFLLACIPIRKYKQNKQILNLGDPSR